VYLTIYITEVLLELSSVELELILIVVMVELGYHHRYIIGVLGHLHYRSGSSEGQTIGTESLWSHRSNIVLYGIMSRVKDSCDLNLTR